MSLRHRNILGWLLLVVSALCWTLGRWQLGFIPTGNALEATLWTDNAGPTEMTIPPTTWPVLSSLTQSPGILTSQPEATGIRQSSNQASRTVLGVILCVLAVAAGGVGILVPWQHFPLLGPDGAALALEVAWILRSSRPLEERGLVDAFFLTLLVLLVAREVWGWIRSRVSLDWCLVSRLAGCWREPRASMLTLSLWFCALTVWVIGMVTRYGLMNRPATVLPVTVAGILCLLCLLRYGTDLRHFGRQLDNFQSGLPIEIRQGSFSHTECQLREIQKSHEEAIRTAITGERFKVELIANVSHDLRTPLTAILGYGELLNQENLSPTGAQQLQRLIQKAGYMRQLVEALFELTKVSSGAVEAKRENIDLLRLLEQTIGLFDDQLTAAGLQIRRHYALNDAPVVTDGARMHQVFANLLGNAIKYALTGTRIHLEVRAEDERYIIRMSNIAAYEMDFRPEEITERFARVDKARTTKGSGIGLAIAQTYTASVGGVFRVAVDGDQFSAIVELPKTERNL